MTASAVPPLDSPGRGSGTAEARNKLLAAAASYQGTPYRYGGLDRNGLDCSGFIYMSFKDSLAVTVPRTTTALYGWAEKINTGDLQPGDLVFFITVGRNISHAGLYLGDGRFIHSASEGPKTGVIYSQLDESYWQRTFAGAGRALPELSMNSNAADNSKPTAAIPKAPAGGSAGGKATTAGKAPTAGNAGGKDTGFADLKGKGFKLGFGFAPSWNGLLEADSPLRGVAFQGRFLWQGTVFGQTIVPGFEIRPEWDNSLGVFRMPFTLSLGFDDKLRFFLGPAFTVGKAALKQGSTERQYEGGNAWFGIAGVSIAPFSIKVSQGKLDFYGEFAWQSYHSEAGIATDWKADRGVSLRFATGVRYTWDL
ncbi:MAG: C40 family peptidase [Treponema sp.]|nr:C40 family peptidase [Treponema sp.]